MWFKKKKKPILPKELSDLPPDARRATEELFGQQLADKALNHRSLKQYDESLKWSEKAYKEYHYKAAISIHGNTLILAGRYEDALKWFIDALAVCSKDSADLILLETMTNIIYLARDHANDLIIAQEYLDGARKIQKTLPQTKDLLIVSSGLDIEEAILLFNKGEIEKAVKLAKRRLELIPDCPRAKSILSRSGSIQPGSLPYYGMIRKAEGGIGLDESVGDIVFRLYRGLEEINISAHMLSMAFLGARTKGWNADFLFAYAQNGDEVFLKINEPVKISKEFSIKLYRILEPLANGADIQELQDLTEFVADGFFTIEEILA